MFEVDEAIDGESSRASSFQVRGNDRDEIRDRKPTIVYKKKEKKKKFGRKYGCATSGHLNGRPHCDLQMHTHQVRMRHILRVRSKVQSFIILIFRKVY